MGPTPPIIRREPQIFAAGDSLIFDRYLPDYLPSAGWSIVGTVSLPTANGATKVWQYTSTPDATNSIHQINVNGFMAAKPEGKYILSEDLVCSPTGVSPNQRSQIYYDELIITADFADGDATVNPLSFAEQQLAQVEEQIAAISQSIVDETDIQRTRIIYKKIEVLDLQRRKYLEEIANQRNLKGIRSGRRNENEHSGFYAGTPC